MPIPTTAYAYVRPTVPDTHRSRAFDDAVAVLEGLGVAHAGVKDVGAGHVLEFRHPDTIAPALSVPPA